MKKTIVLLMACLLACLTGILCLLAFRCAKHGSAQGAEEEAFSLVRKINSMQGEIAGGSGNGGGSRGQGAGGRSSTAVSKVRSYAGGVFQLLSVSPQATHVRFKLPDMNLTETDVNGKRYGVVDAPVANPMGLAGAPELPAYRCDFTVAVGRKHSVKVLSAKIREIPCLPPVPSVGLVARGEEEREPAENPVIYDGNGIYPPEQLAELREYWLRRVPGVGVAVTPVQYDFARGVLRVADSIDFAFCVEAESTDDYERLDRQVDFATLQLCSFANGELLEKDRGDARLPGHILLVVPNEWKSITSEFVAWKKQIGYEVSVAAYPDDTGESVATYVSGKYEQDSVSHLILCGDCGDVPPAYTSKKTSDPGLLEPTSDVLYALLSGDDYVPDLFVSRVPSHSAAQLKGILKKFVMYESTPPENDAWRGKAVFMGSDSSASTQPYMGKRDWEIMAENYAALKAADVLQDGCAEVYAKSGIANNKLKANLKTALNSGAAFMEYLGHGKSTYYVTSEFAVNDANSMQNGSTIPFVFAPVCDTGNFAYPTGDCLAEAFFVGAGCTFGVNGAGAVLASSSQTKWNPPIRSVYEFTQVLIDSYSESRLCSMGAVVHQLVNEGAKLAESYISNSDAYYYTKQMNLFGDCSMMPRLRSLREIVVKHRFTDSETLCIAVKWADDNVPVPGAFVVMTDEAGEQVGVTCTDNDGEAHFACIDGIAEILVNDASTRSVSLSVDCSAQELSENLPTMYVGLNASVSLVPQDWEVLELEALNQLPEGLEVSADGLLSGVPSVAGNYELMFYCLEAMQGNVWLTLSLAIRPGVDSDGDGKVSTPELLEFLNASAHEEDTDDAREAAIALWQVSGTTGGSRTSGEAFCSGEKACRLEYEVTLNEEVTEAFLSQSGAIVKCMEGNTAWIEADVICVARLKAAKVVLREIDDATTAKGETRGTAHYPSQAEMLAELRSLAAEYPARCRFSYVGKSVLGREMVALRVSDLPEDGAAPQLLVAAAIHGNERTGMVIALRLARYLAESENALLGKAVIYILPSMNPDGCEAVTRYNARRYDLNRGFPDGVVLAPLGTFAEGDAVRMAEREPEVHAFMRWCASHRFSAALHLHTGDKLLCYPYGNVKSGKDERISPDNDLFVSLCTTYAEQNPDISKVINAYDYYRVVGEVPDWQYRYLGTLAVTVEMTGSSASGKEPASSEALEQLWQNNQLALMNWAEAASTGVSLSVSSALDGASLPFAKVEASYGQPVFCDAKGQCHRTLLEGNYTVTVSAPGYAPQVIDNVVVQHGESTPLVVALQPDGIGAHLDFSSLRCNPLVAGRMELCLDTEYDGAVVSTILLPDSWNGNLLTGCRAARQEADGAWSYLFLDAAEAQIAFSVATDGVVTNENLVSATVTWYKDAESGCVATDVKRHWLCAEPRQSTFSLSSGWNCIGFTGVYQLDGDFWGYSGTAYERLAKALPGQGTFVFSEAERTLLLDGWDSEEELFGQYVGWSLRAALSPQINNGAFITFSNGTYVKPKTLFVGDAYWSFRRN